MNTGARSAGPVRRVGPSAPTGPRRSVDGFHIAAHLAASGKSVGSVTVAEAPGALAIRRGAIADFGGTLTINPGGDVRLEGGSYEIIENAKGLLLVPLAGLPLEGQPRFASVSAGAVPEPRAFAVLGMTAAAGLLRRRRH